MNVLTALSWLLLTQAGQDPTAAEILEKMSEAVREARGREIKVTWAGDIPRSFTLRVADDGSVQTDHVVVTSEGFYFRGGGRNPVEYRSLEFIPVEQKVPISFLRDGVMGYLLHALAPVQAILCGQGLRVHGTQSVRGEPCFVLVSHIPIRYTPEWNGGGVCGTGSVNHLGWRIRHFVSVKSGRLERAEERTLTDTQGRDYFMTFDFMDWKSGVPGKIHVEHRSEMNQGITLEVFEVAHRASASITARSVRPGEGTLFATRSLDSTVEEALARSPDDPDLLYSAALQWTRTERKDYSKPPDASEASRRLARALALKWGDEAAEMLVAFLVHDKDGAGLDQFMKVVRARSNLSTGLRIGIAESLIKFNRCDEALDLLAGDATKSPDGLCLQILALQQAGRIQEALEVIGKAGPQPEFGYKYSHPLHSLIYQRSQDFSSCLSKAIAKYPKSSYLFLLSLGFHARANPGEFVKTAERALDAGMEEAVSGNILAHVRLLLSQPYGYEKLVLSNLQIQELSKPILSILERLDSRQDSPSLQAMVHRIRGDRKAAFLQLTRSIERMADWTGYPGNFQDTVSMLLGELELHGDGTLWELGFKACMDVSRRKPGWDLPSPRVGAFILHRLESGRQDRLFYDLKGVDPSTIGGRFLGAELNHSSIERVLAAVLDEASKQPSDAEGQVWLARILERASEFAPKGARFDPETYLEAALAANPDHPVALDRLARLRESRRDFEGACEPLRRLIRLAESKPPGINMNGVRVRAAAAHWNAGRTLEAAGFVDRIDFESRELRSQDFWSLSELCLKSNRDDLARKSLDGLVAFGFRPYLLLAELCGRKQDYMGQLRFLNRALYEGADNPPGASGRVESQSSRIEAGNLKSQLMEQVGPDYFIRKFAEAKREPLSAVAQAKAFKCSDRILKGDQAERHRAIEELGKMGPSASAFLADQLDSTDPDVRKRVRDILSDWAEPR